MKLRLTKEFTFEMAHALPAYEGKCHNIHGHSYHFYVTVEGAPLVQQGAPTDGMVLDFHALKEIVTAAVVEPFDHTIVLPNPDAPAATLPTQNTLGGYAAKLLYVPFQPTTENLLMHFADLLADKLPQGTRLHSLKLFETETSCAELIL